MAPPADWRTMTDIHTLNKLIKAQKAKFTRAMSKDTKVCAEFDIPDVLGFDEDIDPGMYKLHGKLAESCKIEIEAEAIWKELKEMMRKRYQILAAAIEELVGEENLGHY